jgi:UDP-3-O-[3-hydroxymyristoyl] glucosamine N-acyltransferase
LSPPAAAIPEPVAGAPSAPDAPPAHAGPDGAPQPSRPRLTSGAVAALLNDALRDAGGAALVGSADVPLDNVEVLDRAGPSHLTFIRSAAFAARWPASRAGAALVSRGIDVPPRPAGSPPSCLIVVDDADLAMIALIERLSPPPVQEPAGVHPTAVVEPGARVDATASVGPHCVVRAGAEVGAGAVLEARVFVGRGAKVGRASRLGPGVSVMDRCVVGAECILHAGVVIGADGFGFRPAPPGHPLHPGLIKIPHAGNAVVGDRVEIGANSCVDRAKFGSTIVGDGTKLDNLVQVGHGVRIGRHSVLCAQVGLAGSVVVGDHVMLGGQAGVADNRTLGDRSVVAAQSGLTRDAAPGEAVGGTPAVPHKMWAQQTAALRRLTRKRTRDDDKRRG